MKKVMIQGIALVSAFFAIWFLLSTVDWMSVFKVEKKATSIEKKLGDLFWKQIRQTEEIIGDDYITRPVDSIVARICSANNIDRKSIKVHVLYDSDVNAFAFPDGHLVINSGLISESQTPEELAGVIGHEISHITQKHVMNKLVKEIGLSLLISMTTGSSRPEMIQETVRMLSSTAFDRKLEKEADLRSVDLLIKASIDPEPFANFLFRLSSKESGMPGFMNWISTHPGSEERAASILEYSKGMENEFQPVLASSTWEEIKKRLAEPE